MKIIGKGLCLSLLFGLILIISSVSASAHCETGSTPCDCARPDWLDTDSRCFISISQFGFTLDNNWLSGNGDLCIFNDLFLYPAYYRCINDEIPNEHYNICDATDPTLIQFAYVRGGGSGNDDYNERKPYKCPNGYLCEQRGEDVNNGGAYCKLSPIKLRSTNSFCGLTKIDSFYRSYPSAAYNPSPSDSKLRVVNNLTSTLCPDGESCMILSGFGAVQSDHQVTPSTDYLLVTNVKRNSGNPVLSINITEHNVYGEIVAFTVIGITPNPSGINEVLTRSFKTTPTTIIINITYQQTVDSVNNELYFSPYFGQSAACTEADNCNDARDNDFDNKIDFADSDCQTTTSCPDFMNETLINGGATDGSDGCCGDDGAGDFGYVGANNTYLCYNHSFDFRGTGNTVEWVYAPEKTFLIMPVNLSGGTVDYISNSQKWYYCNANNIPTKGGLPVVEYGTFPSTQNYSMASLKCWDAANFVTNSNEWKRCGTGHPCCQDSLTVNLFNPEDIKSCQCRLEGTDPVMGFCELFANLPPEQQPDICQSGIQGIIDILLRSPECKENPRKCASILTYNPGEPCDMPPNFGNICSDNQVCANGFMFPVLGSERCCIGNGSYCEFKQNINLTSCEQFGGQLLDNDDPNLLCIPESQSIPVNSTADCCLGVIAHYSLPTSLENNLNSSYICYDAGGDSYFGQCCYSNCTNLYDYQVDSSANRAFSLGVPLHSALSYDYYDDEDSYVVNWLLQSLVVNPNVYISIGDLDLKNISLSPYAYIEFDIMSNSLSGIHNIYINDAPYGPLNNYLVGKSNYKFYHVSIPIRVAQRSQTLQKLTISASGSSSYNLQINRDSVNLVPDNTLANPVSQNYYCTGGFFEWIKELDPEITNPSDPFFTGDDAWMKGYGRYSEACDSQLAFGWTGHYCCGDDTKFGEPYGEYFNDSGVQYKAAKGCFDGNTIINGETVWKSLGYSEYSQMFFKENDELKTSNFTDLIYYNNSFIACQAKDNKYDYYTISHNGVYNSGNPELIQTVIDDQCAVIGEYYCFNGIWRQYVPGLEQSRNEITNSFAPIIPEDLDLKSVPPATELIKNTDFGGGCPVNACND